MAKAEETMASEGLSSFPLSFREKSFGAFWHRGEVRSLSLRGADVRSLARTLFEAACWPMLASSDPQAR